MPGTCLWQGGEEIAGGEQYKKAVKEITYNHIDATDIPDGIYEGECETEIIYARVRVTVEDGRMEKIELLEHRHERGSKAKTIIDKIVDEQRIDVDTVSGATNSCKVIKKAVDNALGQ